MIHEITNQLGQALDKTSELINSLNEPQVNTVPFKGSWTAAQVADHILKSCNGMDTLLSGPGKPANREPDERAEEFRNLFLNFDIKFPSPDFILPDERDFTVKELTVALQFVKDAVLKAIPHSNLSEVPPLGEDHPLNGSTKLELLHFITYHTMRHNHQIRKISSIIN
jgi:hypothetical protein